MNQAPIAFPPDLAIAEDLTSMVAAAPQCEAYPFDDEPIYENLFQTIARILYRRQSVLLTGERGVGKSTIVAELARRAASGRIQFLQSKRILRIDCRHIPLDETRDRIVGIFNFLAGFPDLIACFDGFAAILRTDRLANNKAVLLSLLSQTPCQIIGLVTPREHDELVTDDADFSEHLAKVDVQEPDVAVAVKLLMHYAQGLESKYQLTVDPEAVRQAAVLSANYILNDQLPAKGLKILQRICQDISYERTQLGHNRDRVTVADVTHLVAEVSGVPEETLHGIAENTDYERSLREVVFGQEQAVKAVATELGLIKAGMTDPSKPASVLLFLGQTGTGKTELAKMLARFYSTSKRLRTYTLGNCVEPHSVATIIGVPPGYVGHDQGGRLVNDLNADPYCVFLLDEADKAHPDVLQPFLNLFDEGWISDQRGARAYANKSIFILTSNVGQRMIAEMVEQGKDYQEIATKMKEALSQIRHSKSDRPVFTPEFLARIKRVIVFQPLDRNAMAAITRKQIAEMCDTWKLRRGKQLAIDNDLVHCLAEEANRLNSKARGMEGGRIVRKLIADWIEAGLQRAISEQSQDYRNCQLVTVEKRPDSVSEPNTAAIDALVTVTFSG